MRRISFVSLLVLSTQAWADSTLEGHAVTGELGVNFSSSDPFDDTNFLNQGSDSGVIGAGIEVTLNDPHQTFDFSDDGATLTAYVNTGFGSFPFNGFRFELTDVDAPAFTGFNIASSTFPGFDASRVAISGSRLALNYEGLSGAGTVVIALSNDGIPEPTLSASGTCPGVVDVAIANMTPNGRVAVVKGTGPGSDTVPAGPCVGLTTDLNNLQLVAMLNLNGSGARAVSPTLPLSLCGRPLQVIDLTTCELTNVETLP